ncbi:glycosyltransferase family 4 protein [Chitinimonas sp. PSY-7]|uniref:glycosyltransferase n=1 Tax=Chitinimonas sp. PSY-7 TaxID=3459088 RepID=UPI0040400F9B
MNVLFCESSSNLGGQELQILLQMQLLADNGHRTILACRENSEIAREAARRQLVWQPVAFRSSLHLPSIWAIRNLLRTEHIDAAFCHSGHDCNTLALAARTISRRPLLIRARTYQPGMPKAITYNRLVDKTVVPSEHMRRQILLNPAIKPDRIKVLHPILPLADIRAGASQPLRDDLAKIVNGPGPLIVHAAMLRPEKGHRTILAALPGLRRTFPELRIVFAGQGVELERLQAEVTQLGLDEAVYFAGLMMPVYPLMARADVVIMPSLYEPLGLSQLEALALGVPVAVSNTGGLPETVIHGKTGWVISPGDTAAWETGLTEALSNPTSARKMAMDGRKWVEATYSPEAHLAALLGHLGQYPGNVG